MRRILIADDERMIREGLASTMPWADMGIEVVGIAADGAAALDIVCRERPDLALVDVRMPRMDGLEFLKRAKAELPSIQVVMLSGYQEFGFVREALRHGAADYLLKPATAEALQEAIERVKQRLSEGERASGSSLLRLLAAGSAGASTKGLAELLGAWRIGARHGDEEGALGKLESFFADLRVVSLADRAFRDLALGMADGLFEEFRLAGLAVDASSPIDSFATRESLDESATGGESRAWLRSLTKAAAAFARGSSGNSAVRKAVEWIASHFREDISADLVATVVALSPNYFSSVFKRARGESFSDCLNRLRIEEAKRLLARGDRRVYEVAEEVGYSDYRHFGEVFKKLVGVSPVHYRHADILPDGEKAPERRLLSKREGDQ